MKIDLEQGRMLEHLCRSSITKYEEGAGIDSVGADIGGLGGLLHATNFEENPYLAVPIIFMARRHDLIEKQLCEYYDEIDNAYKSSNFKKFYRILSEVVSRKIKL